VVDRAEINGLSSARRAAEEAGSSMGWRSLRLTLPWRASSAQGFPLNRTSERFDSVLVAVTSLSPTRQ